MHPFPSVSVTWPECWASLCAGIQHLLEKTIKMKSITKGKRISGPKPSFWSMLQQR